MSDKPMIRCPHCEEHIEAERLLPQRKYRNEFGLDVFECPECHQNFKFEPSEYLGIRERIEKGGVPEGVAIEGAKLDDLLPSEKMAIDYDRKPRAMNRRAVPLIMGIVSIGLAAWIIFSFDGWWTFVVAVLLLAFGWPSLKTAFSASDKEIDELTGKRPMSEETKRKLKDRV